ncbi:hypothetical protein ONZ43_g2011 [Nemania bipapillata]|uniref:Uncharacterized protein n=1 Tax=Nemania bipapillata TaxID=110536 RepID=A0ACC2J259_9PEZI|nr:hypothetical protein ONZ43_g2011 [Nemania bipapillata]
MAAFSRSRNPSRALLLLVHRVDGAEDAVDYDAFDPFGPHDGAFLPDLRLVEGRDEVSVDLQPALEEGVVAEDQRAHLVGPVDAWRSTVRKEWLGNVAYDGELVYSRGVEEHIWVST